VTAKPEGFHEHHRHLPELIEAVRQHIRKQMNWEEDVPDYFVLMAALAAALQT
jgi:hypothetical protein